MTVGRRDRMEVLFEGAARRPEELRVAWLEQNCPDDPSLRDEVLDLVEAEADADADRFLARSATGHRPVSQPPDPTEAPRHLGVYRVLARLGEGGMSTVYLAQRADDQFRQRVAIKVIQPGMAKADPLRRFHTERQILASLEHPNIARLYDGGTTDEGLPYYVMELIEGDPIDVYCDRHRLGIAERLELFRHVCGAVHFAHQNLIVHRDLKPSNILVTETGIPKLLDFGIAKLLNPELASPHTQPTLPWGQVLTPDYASPEQLQGRTVTTASDVYSLGVMLYELLTGDLPRRPGEMSREALDAWLNSDPECPPPSSRFTNEKATTDEAKTIARARGLRPEVLRQRLEGDLDQIVAMALSHEPRRRYASAEQLADDLHRHQDGQPVRARRPTWGYRTNRFLRRNRVPMTIAGIGLALLLLAAIGLGVLALRLSEERRQVERQRDRARQYAMLLEEIFQASDPGEGRGVGLTAKEILDRGKLRVNALPDDQAEVRAQLMATLGQIYQRLGFYDEAEPLLEEALASRRQILPPGAREVTDSLEALGTLLTESGDHIRAEALLREALKQRLGRRDEHPSGVAEARGRLGMALRDSGRHQEAEAQLRAALDQRLALLGEDHPQVARTRAWLASTLGLQGRFAEAEPLYLQAISRLRQLPESEHLALAEALNDFASTLIDSGDYDRPELLLEEALAIYDRRLGKNHNLVIANLNNLAALATFRRDFASAESRYRQAYERARKGLGEEHPNITYMLLGIALSRMELGDPASAEPSLRQALAIRRQAFGENHFLTAKAAILLGACLKELGRHGEAAMVLEAGYGVIAAQQPPRPREARRALEHLIEVHQALGAPRRVEDYTMRLRQLAEP